MAAAESIAEWGSEFLLAQAATLARDRRYDEAEDCLRLILEAGPSAKAHLLLGRIYAQQGRTERAEAELQEALRLDPDSEAARAALARVRNLKPVSARWHRLWQVAAGVLAALLVASVFGARRPPDTQAEVDLSPIQVVLSSIDTDIEGLQEAQRELADRLASLPAAQPAAESSAPQAPEPSVLEAAVLADYARVIKRLDAIPAVGSWRSEPAVDGLRLRLVISGTVPSAHLRSAIEKAGNDFHLVTVDARDVSISGRYRVAPGDSLASIAQVVHASGDRWVEIWNANRGTLAEPDHLRVGTELVIR